ncbi:hypothetical protein BJX65DRAFT_267412 [Aspergillus insuetus]
MQVAFRYLGSSSRTIETQQPLTPSALEQWNRTACSPVQNTESATMLLFLLPCASRSRSGLLSAMMMIMMTRMITIATAALACQFPAI